MIEQQNCKLHEIEPKRLEWVWDSMSQKPKKQEVEPKDPLEEIDHKALAEFYAAMRTRMDLKRIEGKSGWQDISKCSDGFLSRQIIKQIMEPDYFSFIDIANYAMMLHTRGASPHLLKEVIT